MNYYLEWGLGGNERKLSTDTHKWKYQKRWHIKASPPYIFHLIIVLLFSKNIPFPSYYTLNVLSSCQPVLRLLLSSKRAEVSLAESWTHLPMLALPHQLLLMHCWSSFLEALLYIGYYSPSLPTPFRGKSSTMKSYSNSTPKSKNLWDKITTYLRLWLSLHSSSSIKKNIFKNFIYTWKSLGYIKNKHNLKIRDWIHPVENKGGDFLPFFFLRVFTLDHL